MAILKDAKIVKIGMEEIEITDDIAYALVIALKEVSEELRKTRMR